jgi:hypothetical protein
VAEVESRGFRWDCVEVRGDLRALRDSKAPAEVLAVGRNALNCLVAALHRERG